GAQRGGARRGGGAARGRGGAGGRPPGGGGRPGRGGGVAHRHSIAAGRRVFSSSDAPLRTRPSDTPKHGSTSRKLEEDKSEGRLDTMSVRVTSERAVDIERDTRESAYAWTRLFAALLLSSIGGVGMWSVIVVLPAIQTEFGVARSAASLPYTMTMICFGFGGILMGRLSDRFGIMVPAVGGALSLGLGYALASQATSLWQFIAAQG